jgi:hypothetical protein
LVIVRRAALIATLTAILPAQGEPARAFVELTASPARCFVQQPFRLVLRAGVEEQFLGANVIQPFRHDLVLPIRIEAGALADLPGAVAIDAPRAGARATFVLNDLPSPGTIERVERDGRRFVAVGFEREMYAEQPGELAIPAPVLRLAYATRFVDDFALGRLPEDQQELVVAGAPASVLVEALPAAGRPADFGGAVGSFALHVEASPRALAVGDTLHVVLRIEGEGNLARCAAPALDAGDRFWLLGSIDDRGARVRTITFDLVPLREDVAEVPPLRMPFFDPDLPGYRLAESAAIALEVRPGTRPAAAPPPAAAGGDDIFDLAAVDGERPRARPRLPAALLAAGALAPWLLALAFALGRRAVRRHARGAGDRRAARAAATFRERAPSDPTALSRALANYLAARLHTAAARIVAFDLATRLVDAGIDARLATETVALLDALDAARFGGETIDAPAARARALVEDLERAFARNAPR